MQVLRVNKSRIPDLGVCTAILNTTDVSRRWYKLNFGPLRVVSFKSCHFYEKKDARGEKGGKKCSFLGKFGVKISRKIS